MGEVLVDLVLKDAMSNGIKNITGLWGALKGNLETLNQVLNATAGVASKHAAEVNKIAVAHRISAEQASVLAYASQVTGKSIEELSKDTSANRVELEKWAKEAEASGLVMSSKTVKAAQEYDQSLKQLEGTVKGLQVELGNALIPTLTEAAQAGNLLITWNKRIASSLDEHKRQVALTTESYDDYVVEALRADYASKGLNVTHEQARQLLSRFGVSIDQAAKNMKLMTREEIEQAKAVDTAKKAFVEHSYAVDQFRDTEQRAAVDMGDMTEKWKQRRQALVDITSTAIAYSEKERDRAKVEAELAALDKQITAQGPLRSIVDKEKTLSAGDARIAELQLAVAREDLTQMTRKAGESDVQWAKRVKSAQEEGMAVTRDLGESEAEWALRVAEANARVADLNDKLQVHTVVVGGATQEQLKQREALQATLDEMQRAAEVQLATSAFQALGKALTEGRLTEDSYLEVTKRLNDQVKLYGDTSLKAATSAVLLNKSLSDTDSADAAWAAIMKYGDGLGRAVNLQQQLSVGQGAPDATLNRRAGGEVEGFASGGSMIVPPGFEHDNYMIGVSSGEHVSVTPASMVSHTRGGDTVYINSQRTENMYRDEQRRQARRERFQ